MALEDLTGTDKGIVALVITNPDGLDPKSEGDNHLRGIKNVLVNTFGPMDPVVVSLPVVGQALEWDGAKYKPAATRGIVQGFVVSGSFQSVLGAKYKITVVGGGGAGNVPAPTGSRTEGGGGGGGTAIKWWTGDGSLVAVTIAGSSQGASFGAIAVAGPGSNSGGIGGGDGGSGTAGDVMLRGQSGGGGMLLADAGAIICGGTGGCSSMGGGGAGGIANSGFPNAVNGGNYGGGGGGGASGGVTGQGAGGLVLVERIA